MNSSQKGRLYFLCGLIAVAVLWLFPTFFRQETPTWWPSKPIKLGLDLRGGSYLVLTVVTEEAVKSYLTSTASEIRAELRKKNVGVIRAKQVGTRGVEVTLINRDGASALESIVRDNFRGFRQVSSPAGEGSFKVTYELGELEAENLKKGAVEQAIETIRNRVDGFGVSEATIQKSGEDRIIVQIPDVTDLEQVKKTIGSVAKLEFRLVADVMKNTVDTVEFRSRDGGGTYRLESDVLMTGDAVDSAQVDINPQNNEVGVDLKLSNVGAKTFDRITSENSGRQLAIVLDGEVQSAPVIRERISGGRASISGSFTPQEANWLKVVLRSGALPAPLVFEEQRVIGASLGADSIRSGLIASAAGGLLVVVFMIGYYRKCGMQAVWCTVLNIVFLLALLSLFGATLTLPGIAGLALTLGMAVDANVIIFERIREELRKGASERVAVEAGFDKAHWTILDANITTLLTGIILYAFGTGPVKGFAVTLSLGIVTTVFAALYISKLFFEIFDMRNAKGKLSI